MPEDKAITEGISADGGSRQPADTRLLRVLDHPARGRETLGVRLSIRGGPRSRAKSLNTHSGCSQEMEVCTPHSSTAPCSYMGWETSQGCGKAPHGKKIPHFHP